MGGDRESVEGRREVRMVRKVRGRMVKVVVGMQLLKRMFGSSFFPFLWKAKSPMPKIKLQR